MQSHELLEVALARWLGTTPRQIVACSSGTAALHLAVEGLRDRIHEPIVVPDYTMISCARAVTLGDKKCRFVGCDENLLMDLSDVSDVDSVMLVHIYGRQVDNPLASVQIEDMAELHGVKPYPNSDAACWSFYRNKIVHGEEGGAVWFADPKRADLARSLRSVGFTLEHDYTHIPRGCNYRLASSLARQILVSLREFMTNYLHRRQAENVYNEHLCEWSLGKRKSPWVYDLRVSGMTRQQQKEIVARLNKLGVAARMGFVPMTMQPEYRDTTTQETIRAWDEVFYLPLDITCDQAALVGSQVATLLDST